MLIDTHVHLLDEKFNKDRKEVLEKAFKQNIFKIIEIGCEPESWEKTVSFANENKDIYCALGIHPHNAKSATKDIWQKLEILAQNKKCVGIGETGLDYYYNYSPRQTQKEVFEYQINFAKKINRPLVIHCRNAYPDLIDILDNFIKKHGNVKGVIHCFSGNYEDAKKLISMGFFLGIDGPITYENAKTLREVVLKVPLENILVETDSPYLPPQNYREQRNEPSFLFLITKHIAVLKNVNNEIIEEITTNNASKLFGISL